MTTLSTDPLVVVVVAAPDDQAISRSVDQPIGCLVDWLHAAQSKNQLCDTMNKRTGVPEPLQSDLSGRELRFSKSDFFGLLGIVCLGRRRKSRCYIFAEDHVNS